MPPKRKSYTVEFKLAIVARIENGESLHKLEKELGVTRKMMREWKKLKQELVGEDKKRSKRKVSTVKVEP